MSDLEPSRQIIDAHRDMNNDSRELMELPANELTIHELKQRLALITTAMREVMKPGVHYGLIPGVKKPSLFKPGAETLGVLFQFGGRPRAVAKTYDGEHLTVDVEYEMFHIPSGRIIGVGVGSCSTKESKYAYRQGGRACPSCGSFAISRSKYPVPREATEKGWYCRDCKAQYPFNDRAIQEQQTGRIANPDLADQYNTILKMAKKRAKIDVTLDATGASAIFTQDVEDFAPRGSSNDDPPDDINDSFDREEAERAQRAAEGPQQQPLRPTDRASKEARTAFMRALRGVFEKDAGDEWLAKQIGDKKGADLTVGDLADLYQRLDTERQSQQGEEAR